MRSRIMFLILLLLFLVLGALAARLMAQEEETPADQDQQEQEIVTPEEIYLFTEQACELLRQEPSLPVICAMQRGAPPVLMLLFRSEEEFRVLIMPVTEVLGNVFCNGLLAHNLDPMISISLADKRVYSLYSCHDRKVTRWLPWAEPPAPGPPAPPPAPETPRHQPVRPSYRVPTMGA